MFNVRIQYSYISVLFPYAIAYQPMTRSHGPLWFCIPQPHLGQFVFKQCCFWVSIAEPVIGWVCLLSVNLEGWARLPLLGWWLGRKKKEENVNDSLTEIQLFLQLSSHAALELQGKKWLAFSTSLYCWDAVLNASWKQICTAHQTDMKPRFIKIPLAYLQLEAMNVVLCKFQKIEFCLLN